MVVVENLRQPLVVEHAVDVLGLGLRRGKEVAVVVVADVLLVEARQPRGAALERIGIPHVPVSDEIVAVGIGVDEKDDALVQEPHRLAIRSADHLVDHLGELLRAERLGRVQSAVDPDDRLAFPRQPARLVLRDALGKRQPARDVAILREILVVGWRGDDRHELRPALGRLADFLQHHAVRLGVELPPVGGNLRVIGEPIVVAETEAELLLRRGDASLGGRRREHRGSDHGCRAGAHG